MPLLSPPLSRTNFFKAVEEINGFNAERTRQVIATGLDLANRFVHLNLQVVEADLALQGHFLPLVKAALTEGGVVEAEEVVRHIPIDSAAHVYARALIHEWRARNPS